MEGVDRLELCAAKGGGAISSLALRFISGFVEGLGAELLALKISSSMQHSAATSVDNA